MNKIKEKLTTDAQAWCKKINSPEAWSVNIAPAARILTETKQPDGSVLVRTVMHFQTWEWPPSGSGWGDYHFRAIDVTFMNDTKTAERVIGEYQIHVTEHQDETFDWQAALAEFSRRFE